MILATILLSISPAALPTQQRVDKLIKQCDAATVIQLVARSRNEVEMQMQIAGRATTANENAKFSCVLDGMRRMKDLSFGFVGNATPAKQ